MNKFFAKLAGALSLVALVAGAGVAVASGVNAKGVRADNELAATFTCGADGDASHADGSAGTYSDTDGDYSISASGTNLYIGARDATGNGCLKLGTSKNVGSFSFTVPNDVILAKIYVGGYKSTAAKISVNSGATQTISTMSNSGQYTAVDADTSSSKTVSFTTVSGGVRAMINTIEFYREASSEKEDTSVTINNTKPLALDINDDPVQLSVTTDPADLPLTYTSSNSSVASVSNSGLVTVEGLGSATITVSYAGDDQYKSSSDTIAINVTEAEPAHVTGKTISEIVAATTETEGKLVYEVTGFVTAWQGSNTNGTKYGNFYIADEAGDTTNHAYVYGANYENPCTWDGTKYTFSNKQDFLTNDVTKTIVIGSQITARFTAFLYNGTTFEFQGEIVSVSNTKTLESISLSGDYQTSFELNEAFSYDGLIVTAHYDNGSSTAVTPTSVSTPDMTSIGEKTVTVSYTEDEVTKDAEYVIEVTAVSVKWTISFDPGEGSGEMASVQVKDGDDYTLPACTFTAPSGKVFDYWDVYGEAKEIIENVDDDYEVTAMWKDAPSEVNDQITYESLGISGTSYVDATVNGTSGAVYSVNSCGNTNNYVQIKSNGSSSGIVTTTSGGDLASVTINFNSGTQATRTVSIYGKTSAYSSAADLYGDSKGTLLGEINIDDGASQTLNVEGSYQYVGVRSKSGAIYMDSVVFTWGGSPTPPEPKVLESISVSGAKTDFYVGDDFDTTGLVVTAHYDDSSESVITDGYTVDSSAVNKDAAGTYNIVVSYEGKSDNYDVTYANPVLATYKKVESNLADFSGDCLIVWEGEEPVAMDGSLTSFGAGDFFSVSITNNTIQASETREFHIAAKEGGYSIQAASGKYIGKTADSNGVDANDTDKYVNTISYVGDETSDIDIVAESNGHLRCNGSDQRIVFYKGSTYTGQKAVALYQKVADDGEALMLDLLNTTSVACAAEGEHTKADFETAWSALKTAYNAISDETALNKLATTDGNAKGTMFYEALARYDLLVGKYGLDNFISGRVVSSLGNTSVISNGSVDSNSAMIIITVIALTSISSIAVLLVIKRRKAIR